MSKDVANALREEKEEAGGEGPFFPINVNTYAVLPSRHPWQTWLINSGIPSH